MAFKRESVIVNTQRYFSMTVTEIQEIIKDKTISQFEAVTILGSTYNITDKQDIERKAAELYEKVVPDNFKNALGNISKVTVVAYILNYFSDIVAYAKLNNKQVTENKNTLALKYTEEGETYFKNKLGSSKQSLQKYIAEKCLDLPYEFKDKYRYLTTDVALVYMFEKEYTRYSSIISEAEYRAIYYPKDTVRQLAGLLNNDVMAYIENYLRMYSARTVSRLLSMGYSKEAVVALLLSTDNRKIDLTMLGVSIPGEIKDEVLSNYNSITRRFRVEAFKTKTFKTYVINKGKIIFIEMEGKNYNEEAIIKLLRKKFPLAILNEAKDEGIYLGKDGTLRRYKPLIKEESL